MTVATESQGLIVVVEQGSDWPSWIEQCSAGAGGAHVFSQEEEEAPLALAERVAEACRKMPGESLELAVIACNERSDESAVIARRVVARTLLPLMHDAQSKLLFSAGQRQSGRSRRVLCELASDLAQELAGPAVSVRFGSEHRSAARDVA